MNDIRYYKNLNIFNKGQLIVIARGIKENLDVSIFAKKEYNYKQMSLIRAGLYDKIDINLYLNPNYSENVMKEIYYLLINARYGYENLTYEEKLNKINLLILENA